MNKSLQKILALSALVLGFGVTASVLADDKVCTTCHDASWEKPILSIYQTKHGVKADGRTPGCQTCHGVSDGHLKSPSTSPDVVFGANAQNSAKDKNAVCMTCHKAGNRTHWASSAHDSNGLACASCHTVHAAKDKVLTKATQTEVCFTCHTDQRADSKKISVHPLDKIGCTGCHNPHGSAGNKMVKKNTNNETCFTCHTEKRGPFLWEHQSAAEDCANCHTPHGSNIGPLLKARPNFLCQECHDGVHQSGSPVGPLGAGFQGGMKAQNTANVTTYAPGVGNVGRQCMNCHTQIHGSNSPNGSWLHR